MNDKPENPPAFPHLGLYQGADGNLHPTPTQHSGLTMRDYFAATALSALIAKMPAKIVPECESHPLSDEAASGAYVYADAMLKARWP